MLAVWAMGIEFYKASAFGVDGACELPRWLGGVDFLWCL